MMALGALAISTCSASEGEYASWKRQQYGKSELYGIDPEYVRARMEGRDRMQARFAERGRTGCSSLLPTLDLCWSGRARSSAADGYSDRLARRSSRLHCCRAGGWRRGAVACHEV